MNFPKALITCLLLVSHCVSINAQSDDRENFKLEYYEQGYIGSYEILPKRYMLISLSWDGDLQYLDTGTGLFGNLKRSSDSVFVEKEGLSVSFKHGVRKQIIAVDFQVGGSQEQSAKNHGLRFEELRIPVEGATLAATILLPAGNGPFPLLIINGGASWVVREQLLQEGLLYSSHGVAALIYDKRGFGESTGEQTVRFAVSANDLVSMSSFLKLRTDVIPTQVGVSTYSQSGWYGTLAASTSKDISFLILNVPPATTVFRQEFLRVENELRADGFHEVEIKEAMSFMSLMSWFSRTNRGWEEYLAARNDGKNKEWFKYVFAPKANDPELWKWGRMNWEYNPLPSLQKIIVPTLVILGEMDKKVLPEVNRAIFEMAFDVARNRDYTIRVIPNMNHDLVFSKHGGRKEQTENRFVLDLIKLRLQWLSRHVNNSE